MGDQQTFQFFAEYQLNLTLQFTLKKSKNSAFFISHKISLILCGKFAKNLRELNKKS